MIAIPVTVSGNDSELHLRLGLRFGAPPWRLTELRDAEWVRGLVREKIAGARCLLNELGCSDNEALIVTVRGE